jgi:hypothetical protein
MPDIPTVVATPKEALDTVNRDLDGTALGAYLLTNRLACEWRSNVGERLYIVQRFDYLLTNDPGAITGTAANDIDSVTYTITPLVAELDHSLRRYAVEAVWHYLGTHKPHRVYQLTRALTAESAR